MVGILNNSVRYEVIDEGSNGQKIDNYLIKIIKNVPKSHIYKLLRSGQVRVNKKRVRTDFRLSIGDSVRIPPFKSSSKQSKKVVSIKPEQKVLVEDAVIYEDDALIAINNSITAGRINTIMKEKGWLCKKTSDGDKTVDQYDYQVY